MARGGLVAISQMLAFGMYLVAFVSMLFVIPANNRLFYVSTRSSAFTSTVLRIIKKELTQLTTHRYPNPAVCAPVVA